MRKKRYEKNTQEAIDYIVHNKDKNKVKNTLSFEKSFCEEVNDLSGHLPSC